MTVDISFNDDVSYSFSSSMFPSCCLPIVCLTLKLLYSPQRYHLICFLIRIKNLALDGSFVQFADFLQLWKFIIWRGVSTWRPRGFVDQWSQIRINFRIRIKGKKWTRIRIHFKVKSWIRIHTKK
jgi:hypothetical protein